MISVALKGAGLAGSLIIAIGSQNAFVLKQGLQRNHIIYVTTICFVCDVLLMSSGIFGLSSIIHESLYLMIGLSLSGALFLYWYGLNSFASAIKGNSHMRSDTNSKNNTNRTKIIISTLAVTLLNPHVYIDTVVIVGGIAVVLSFEEKLWFLAGAIIASCSWFYCLGYGARLMNPFFANSRTWQILDTGIGLVMWWIATDLLLESVQILTLISG